MMTAVILAKHDETAAILRIMMTAVILAKHDETAVILQIMMTAVILAKHDKTAVILAKPESQYFFQPSLKAQAQNMIARALSKPAPSQAVG